MRPTFLPARLLLLLTMTVPLLASNDRTAVAWDQVCQYTKGHELKLTVQGDGTVQGYCMAVDVDQIQVRTSGGKVVRIARNTLQRIEMSRPPRHQVRALGRGMHKALHSGVGLLFSPMAPVGLVAVPGTLAWGAVAAPFCVLGDVAELGHHPSQEIRVR